MNPHRFTWGLAYDFPVAAVIAAGTLAGLLFTREPKQLPLTPTTMVWLGFTLWVGVTTIFAIFPDHAFAEWGRTMKIMLFSFVMVMIMREPQRLHLLIWVVVISIGFFGLKGGAFTLLHPTGGRQLVYGPPDSFIGENNALALATIMTIPLMRYLQLSSNDKWIKRGLLVLMLMSSISVIGSFSRGALLAAGAMVTYLWLKSPKRLASGIVIALVLAVALVIAPEQWFERMHTIGEYKEDASAMGRINAWWMAFHLANDRPLVGGGFDAFDAVTFARYAPVPDDIHDAHSIYFEVLAEQGYVGLLLFLLLGWFSLRSGKWVRNKTRNRPDLKWAHELSGMLQVSMIGYAVGGAFLGLAYFDLYYSLVAMMVITHWLVKDALARERQAEVLGTAEPVEARAVSGRP